MVGFENYEKAYTLRNVALQNYMKGIRDGVDKKTLDELRDASIEAQTASDDAYEADFWANYGVSPSCL